MSTRPESEQSTIDIAQIEKSFPAPPKSSHGFRKTLPPLPPMAEIEKDAAEAAALEGNRRTAEVESRTLSPVRGGLDKELPVPFGISRAKSARAVSRDEPRPGTASTFTSIDPKRILKHGTGKHRMVELSPQPSEDPKDPLVQTQASRERLELSADGKFRTGRCGRKISTFSRYCLWWPLSVR